MKQKVLAGFLTVTMLSGLLIGCGQSGEDHLENSQSVSKTDTDEDKKSSGEEKTLEIFYWDDLETSTDLTTQQFKVAVDMFNEADNGYKIKVTTSDISNYYIKLNALVAADDLPDVFMCHPGNLMRNAAEAGVLMPLDDVMAEDGWYDTFNPAYFDSLKYEDQIVAMPMEAASACVFYNKDIFEQVQAEIPNNWEEFLNVCQKIKDGGFTPIVTSGAEDWVIGILGGYLSDRNGGYVNSIVDGSLDWTDESFVNAGNCMKELADQGYFQDSFLGDSNAQMTSKFITGQAAMMVTGSWAISDINGVESTVADSVGVFPFPAIDEAKSDANRWIIKTDNICIDHDTENLEAAVEFLKLLSGEEVQKNFSEIAGRLPVLQNLEINFDKAPIQLKELSDYMANMSGSFGYYNETLPSETGSEFDNAFFTIAMGQASPEEAFARVQEVFEQESAQ